MSNKRRLANATEEGRSKTKELRTKPNITTKLHHEPIITKVMFSKALMTSDDIIKYAIPNVLVDIMADYLYHQRMICVGDHFNSCLWSICMVNNKPNITMLSLNMANLDSVTGIFDTFDGGVARTIGDYIYHHYAELRGIRSYERMVRYHPVNGTCEDLSGISRLSSNWSSPTYGCVLNGRFYVGGYEKTGHDINCYDPVTDSWSEITSSISPHYTGGAIAMNNRVILCSGEDVTEMEAFDPRCNETRWNKLAPIRSPHCRSFLVSPNDYTFFVVGGFISCSSLQKRERFCDLPQYDTRNNQWLYFDNPLTHSGPQYFNSKFQIIDGTLVCLENQSLYYTSSLTPPFHWNSYEIPVTENCIHCSSSVVY